MLEFINSLEKYFNINKVGGEKNFQTNKNKLSEYNDNQIIVNYVNNINQYKLYIQMLRSYSIKNEYITNSIKNYQQQIKKLFELIKKIINESNSIDINKLLNNTHFTNNPNIIIEDNLDFNKDKLLKKQKYLDNIFNSLSDTLLEIKGGLSSDYNYDSGIITIKKDLQEINKKLETEVLTNEQKDVLKKSIYELEKKFNEHESKTNDEITKFIKDNDKYKQENDKYKQDNDKYKQDNDKYKQENDKYKQENDKYKQEILLKTPSGTIRIENISDDDMKLIKDYFKECYDYKNYKIVIQKYLKFVDEKKKLLGMKKNEFIEKLDNLLFNTLGINVPLEDVFTNIFNDIEPENLDETQIYVVYLDLDKNNFFDNNENVQENINYLLRLIKIFYPNVKDFDKKFNNDFICGLEKKITDYVKSKKTIEKYLSENNIIDTDKNYVRDLTTKEYAELQKLLNNNNQFIDNYIKNKQIYIKPDDLIDLNDELNNKFNNEHKPIELKSLFNNKYGIDIYNRKSELFYSIDPPNFDELTKSDEFENYLRRNFINYSNKLVVPRATAEERRNSSEIILKEIIYNLKKNLIFQSFKYSIEIVDGKSVNTKINDLQTRVSQKKINDTLCNIKNQIKKEEVKTQKSFEAMEKNKKYLKIDGTNNFDWNKWLNFYFDYDNSLKNTKQTKDISDTKDKLTKLKKALENPTPENISNIDLSGFITNKCKYYTPYSKEPVYINLIEIKKDNLFVCSYSLLKYKTDENINIELEKDTSEKKYDKIIDKPRPPSPFGLPSRLPSLPPSPFQQQNFLEQIKLKEKKTETENEDQENPKSINNSFLDELKNEIGSQLKLRKPIVGGDNNDYYKNKYFKYKNKYLELKNKYL